jgi:hypothetical protein
MRPENTDRIRPPSSSDESPALIWAVELLPAEIRDRSAGMYDILRAPAIMTAGALASTYTVLPALTGSGSIVLATRGGHVSE